MMTGSAQSTKIRLQLDEAFGDEEPDLTELDLYIENRALGIELEKIRKSIRKMH